MRTALALLIAFLRGIPDGWRQPYALSTSRNMDDLAEWGDTDDAYNWGDSGINVGQLLRAGTKSEAWSENYWPVSVFRKIKN
jgi:hypothetical protein